MVAHVFPRFMEISWATASSHNDHRTLNHLTGAWSTKRCRFPRASEIVHVVAAGIVLWNQPGNLHPQLTLPLLLLVLCRLSLYLVQR